MRLYSYVVAYDSGSAPNPFWGCCTLAICKPSIRRTAKAGDWVVGIGPANKPTRGKVVYAMQVSEVMSLDAYFRDVRFAAKKPRRGSHDPRHCVGDNVYRQVNGEWRKYAGGTHTEAHLEKDVSGKNVLIGKRFYYFGREAVALPKRLALVGKGGQGHRSWFPRTYIHILESWLEKAYAPGIHGGPEAMANFGDCGGCVKGVSDC
jgi:hypothetical protein